jgi:hypothetical protein
MLALSAMTSLEAQAGNWKSGSRTSTNATATSFATWRGTPLGVVSGWITWKNGWSGMQSYASGTNPRRLRSMSPNVSFGHGLFPSGGSLSACAAGSYDKDHAEVARRLAANGVGDAEIRLGWEASGDWFPWSAAGKPPEQWKACFVRVAKAMKGAAPNLRIGWFMAKKGRIDINTIYPDGPDSAVITNIGVSHYDDAQARFGTETYKGGPWGLRAFVEFARSKGKKFAIGEWGVGRSGDNPTYIQNMHDFLEWAGDSIAHEAYFNTKEHQLHPTTKLPKSAALYQNLF